MKSIPEYGDHMTIGQWIDQVLLGMFVNYDGHGKYATHDEMSDIIVVPSDVREGKIDFNWTHIVWFNK